MRMALWLVPPLLLLLQRSIADVQLLTGRHFLFVCTVVSPAGTRVEMVMGILFGVVVEDDRFSRRGRPPPPSTPRVDF